MAQKQAVLGVIIGNRDSRPDITTARQTLLDVFAALDIEPVILDESTTKLGAVDLERCAKCAALFDEHRHRIDGILISLPNFGDEKAAVEAIKLSAWVPILVQAFPDARALTPEFACLLREDLRLQ